MKCAAATAAAAVGKANGVLGLGLFAVLNITRVCSDAFLQISSIIHRGGDKAVNYVNVCSFHSMRIYRRHGNLLAPLTIAK